MELWTHRAWGQVYAALSACRACPASAVVDASTTRLGWQGGPAGPPCRHARHRCTSARLCAATHSPQVADPLLPIGMTEIGTMTSIFPIAYGFRCAQHERWPLQLTAAAHRTLQPTAAAHRFGASRRAPCLWPPQYAGQPCQMRRLCVAASPAAVTTAGSLAGACARVCCAARGLPPRRRCTFKRCVARTGPV